MKKLILFMCFAVASLTDAANYRQFVKNQARAEALHAMNVRYNKVLCAVQDAFDEGADDEKICRELSFLQAGDIALLNNGALWCCLIRHEYAVGIQFLVESGIEVSWGKHPFDGRVGDCVERLIRRFHKLNLLQYLSTNRRFNAVRYRFFPSVRCLVCLKGEEPYSRIWHYKTRCGHVFHRECISQWLQIRQQEGLDPNCPTCRAQIL